MGVRTRQKQTSIAQRRARVADWYCSGKTVYAIAELAGVHHATVTRDLAAIRQQWRDSAVRDFDAARAVELAKIDRLERQYWEAWEKSCKDAVVKTTERTGDDTKRRYQRTGQ